MMHYSRQLRTGTTDDRTFEVRIHSNGYETIQMRDHVLAAGSGFVYVHRLTVFNAIGYGPHRCHWCRAHVNWRAPGAHRLEVDHVDANKTNNDPNNLVPSCHGCNTRRAYAA